MWGRTVSQQHAQYACERGEHGHVWVGGLGKAMNVRLGISGFVGGPRGASEGLHAGE